VHLYDIFVINSHPWLHLALCYNKDITSWDMTNLDQSVFAGSNVRRQLIMKELITTLVHLNSSFKTSFIFQYINDNFSSTDVPSCFKL